MRVRTSIGNRILSVLLVACMVFGMIPLSIFSVSAAATDNATTQASLEAIRSYASTLLNKNFSKTSSAPSWDTEGKSDTWRYYNGVMLDALLMLGVDSNAGNALEYAKDFMDANIDSSGKITNWHAKEVDSVPPALALFDLLDTAEVDSDTRADYVTAINYVYKQMENQTKYSNCGGNFLHKMDNDSWSTWNIGLDGIYMAQPFLMEYAAALEAGKITNTVNSKSASDIYKEVYDRLMWVADYMYDEDTGLYHHGWNVSGNKGNGHFWSRGIGWYAAGLVMCIDLMPAGTYKTDLIGKLPKLFDGMMQYQDDSTGLWYNVVNRDSSLTSNNGNKLETSGSALMAYAMIKAYNEGWVKDAKYATAGVEAFNGIVANKLKSGKITDIYKSSGVCTADGDYCKNSYESDEAKGVGPVFMAAAEASKYLGNAETFGVGVVVAPEMTIAAGAATIDTSNVKVSLLSNHGTIANGVAGYMNYEVGAASNGKATVSVYNGDILIGTFEVKVVDPSTPAEGEGSLGIETGETVVPSNPSFSAGDWTDVSTGGDGAGFVLTTTLQAGVPYIFTKDIGSNSVNGAGYSSGKIAGLTVKGTKEATDGVYTLSVDSGSLIYWYVDSENRIYTVDGNTNYYLRLTGSSSGNIELTTTASDASKFSFSVSSGKIQLTDSARKRNAYINSSGFTNASSGTSNAVYAFTAQTAGDATYAKLTGTQGFVYPFGVASGDIITDIKASTDFKVLVSANADGSDYTEVAMSNSLVTVEKNSDYKNDEAKTNNFIVKYDGKQIGTIPVVVYDDSSSVTNYDVNFAVTPGAVVATVGDANKQLNVSAFSVGNLGGIGYTVEYSGGSSSVATVTKDGLVTIVGEGSTTITATVVAITYDGKTYTSADFGTITATIPVVVNAEPVVQEVTYSITGLTILPASVTAGDSAQATATAAASDGSGNHSYTFNYSISGSGVSINSTTGAITTTASASGTYTVTATLGKVDGEGAFNAGTVTKTATFTVVEAEEPTEPTTAPTVPTEPDAPSGDIAVPSVNADTVYTRLTALSDKYTYVVIGRNSSQRTATHGTDPGVQEAAWTSVEGGWKYGAAAHMWVIEKIDNSSNYYIYYMDGTTKYYLNGNGSNNLVCSTTADTQWTITFNGEQADVRVASGSHGNADNRIYLNIDGSAGPKFESSAQSLNLYAPVNAGSEEPHEHSYTSSVTTQPGCETTGVRTYVCSGCEEGTEGHSYTETIAATGHSWNSGVVTTEPGCETTGVRTYTCANDGSHTKTETISATGHNYVNGTCSNCSAADPNAGSGETTTSEHNFDATEDVTPGEDKAAIAAGTTYDDGYFKVVGKVTQRVSSGNVTSVEIDKNGTGAMEFTVTGTATVTIEVSSTGGSNKSTVAIVDASGKTVANAEGITEVSGTGKTTLTYNLPAGTYQLVSPESDNNRGFRLYTIDVAETTSGGTTPSPDPDVPAGVQYVLDTDGIDDGAEYLIVDLYSGKYYALGHSGTGEKSYAVTINGNIATIDEANVATALWTFTKNSGNSYYISNDGVYIKSGSSTVIGSSKTSVDAIAYNLANGEYRIDLDSGSNIRDLNANSTSGWDRGGSSDTLPILLFKKVGGGEAVVTPVSAVATPDKVDVPNSGIVDLSGVKLEVTMSDGSKKTVQNANLTYDVSGINTALAGNYTVPVSYTENGKTVTANVSVVVAAASSGGGTTSSDLWKHDFTADGDTDADKWYNISANYSNSYSGSYGDLDFDRAMKMESSTKVTFDAPNAGTFTLVFDTKDSPGHSVYLTHPNGTKKSYTVPSDGVLTIDLAEGGEYLLQKNSGSSYVFYMEYASAVTDGIQITAPGTLYIAGTTGWENAAPTHNLQYTVKHNDQNASAGDYTIEWTSLDESVVRVDANGKITGLKSGATSISAKVTMDDGTVYNGTVVVTVVGPGVSATEEMELILGETGKDSGTIASTVYAGGTTTNNFTLGYFSSNESVATVDPVTGVVTAQGKGEATIYTYVSHVNGYQIYSGTPSVDAIPNIYDTTTVTVTAKEVIDAHLNSYDYVAKTTDSKTDFSNIHAALEALELNIYFNTGDSIEGIKWNDPNLTIDFSKVDPTSPTIQTAVITYVDPVMGELFRDTIWIHLETFDPTQYDGIVTYEDGVHFILDTDGIDANEEYAIVPGSNSNVALRNPNATATGSGAAGSTSVTLAHGDVITKVDNSGNIIFSDVDYLTMSDSDVEFTSWLMDTFVENVVCADGVTRTQMNASSLLRYLGGGTSMAELIHTNVTHVYLETVSEVDGEYRIVLGFGRNNQPYYLGYENGIWTATTEASSVYMYNKHIEVTQDYGIDYDLVPNEMGIPEGFVADPIDPVVIFNEDTRVSKGNYTIVWSSSNEKVATVDQNGVVTGVAPGKATISATLYDVYGMVIVCTTHNVEHITKTVEVEVTSSNPTPELKPNEMTIGAGSMPNFSKVAVMMTYPGTSGEYDYAVPFDQLNFKLADATGKAADGTTMDHFDNTVVGTYQVPVTYAGQNFTLTIHVVEDPYAGLEEADSIPGYPDAGSVRMNKTAKGVLDFTQTGVTKIELTAAGVSTKNSVDVVLIVDVSNSMGWTTTWFNGMSDSEVDKATDSQKIPSGGAGTGTDKLALAMDTADQFADILLNVDGGDNTITFVTFAGADRDHGGSSDYVDSVRTPMVGISDYSIASKVFGDTKFTTLTKDGTGATYKLQIGGYDDDGYGEAKVSGTNRGNTNYDYAFGEAIDAVNQLKKKYNATHSDTYDESGRQIHVVFMTDGAPSHYNNQRGNGNAKDTFWDGSGSSYSNLSGNSEANWLTYIKNYNELATKLLPMIDGAYTVGFDMAHGGFGDYSYGLDDMQRVLEGLAKNTIVPVTLADDEEELNDYFTSLARALAYAGTNAKVTDTIGGDFSLFTGPSMYSSDITAGGIMSEETLAAMQAMSFPITVNSYTLVTASDLGKSMSVIMNDGSIATVTVKDEHLGLRVNEAPEILEQITFSADGTQAYSTLKSGNIMSVNSKGERVIDAETFTYTATLDTVIHEGVQTVHAKDEQIVWKIGTITDKEVAMEYYAYLDGSLDNPREAVAGVYATNEYAYAEYIDVYGKYVKRYYGVPQVAWGAGSVTVRFFLVNKDGQYVNRAGVTFTNPANRIFLDGRAHYEAELNNAVSFTALDALAQAGLAGTNTLYDVSAGATVTNSTTAGQGGVDWVMNNSLNNIANLLTYVDSSNGFYSSVVIDIPVVMTDLGESERPMAGETVVVDYGKPIEIDLFAPEEKLYAAGYANHRPGEADGQLYWYTMEIVGFAAYSSSFDQRDYVMATSISNTYTTSNGKYEVISAHGDTQVKFTPSGIMDGMDQVFVAVAFQEYEAIANGDGTYRQGEIIEEGVYYMYKQLNVIPATIVYYETDGNVGGSFSYTGDWTLELSDAKGKAEQDVYTVGGTYGYDSSYLGDSTLSNGASRKAAGAGVDKTTATFTFTGTGFDIISRTDADQGSIRVQVKNASGNVVKTVSVINKGENELYQIPVVSVDLETYGTYTVEIGVYPAVNYGIPALDRGNEFYFDAVRIYGTMTGAETFNEAAMVNDRYTTTTHTVESVYEGDGEANPVFTEIRDILIDADKFASSGSNITGAMFMDDFGTGEVNVTNYEGFGANNEVYLKPNQAIAFSFSLSAANKAFDIGLKSANGESVNAMVSIMANGNTVSKELTIGSSTAQFYDLLAETGFKGTGAIHVIIRNVSGGILSLTDLKYNGSGSIVSNYQTYLAARTVMGGEYDVYSAVFADDSVRIARTTTMTVVTSTEVESLVITNCYGEEVWFSATSQDVGSQRIWTVKLRPVLQGEQSFTVTGCAEDGTTGASASDIIHVELY